MPHTSIDTEAAWEIAGWHGWWYGWKLHLVVTAGHCWLPLAAELTPANVADGPTAEQMLPMVTAEAKYVLGDSHYQTEGVAKQCEQAGRYLLAPGVNASARLMTPDERWGASCTSCGRVR